MRRPGVALVLAVCAATAPAVAAAQTRVFGGYDFTRQQATPDREARTRHGIAAALDHDFVGALGLKFQAAHGSRRSGNVEDSHTLLAGGPVFHLVRSPRLDIFLHALGGTIRRSEGFQVFDVGVARSARHAMGLVGGGVDIAWNDNLSVRLDGGYILSGGRAENLGRVRAVRASTGVVYRFGSR